MQRGRTVSWQSLNVRWEVILRGLVVGLLAMTMIACSELATPSASVSGSAPVTPTFPLTTTLPAMSNAQVCASGACMALNDWAAGIDKAINHEAVGYNYLILDHGQVAISRSYGYARTAPDAPSVVFGPATALNDASVSKTVTAVAALTLLAQKHISVDAPMYPYLPKSWPLGPNITTITFRQLLNHTSGIRSTYDLATTYADLRGLMAQGIRLSDKTYHYQNHNFALFRVLIPDILGFDDTGMADPADATAQRFLSYLQTVYGKYFPVTCTPGTNPTLAYPFPDASVAGFAWGDYLENCGAVGVQLSTDQLAIFLAQLNRGAFLNADQLQAMYTGFLGWDYAFADTTYGECFTKNGFLYWNTRGHTFDLTTLLVSCPATGLGFVGIANSRLGGATTATYGFPGSWDDIVQGAYTAAWK